MKKLACFLSLVLTLCACAPTQPVETDTTTKFESAGFTLSIPNEYVDLLLVDTTVHTEPDGTFFSVHEKASVEASQEMHPDDPTMGGGFLFGIGRVDEAIFHEMMIWGMTGADVFARDWDGNYYIYYHPTDVQLIRAGEYTEADWKQWTQLGLWSNGVKQTFVADNPALVAYERTYADVDCALHYLAYGEGSARLHYNDGDAIYTPERTDSMPYLEQLLDDVLYLSYQDGDLNFDGGYITLIAPEMFGHASFDFFTDEGQQHIIRQNFHLSDDAEIESVFYVASKNGEFFPAGKIVADWLASLA